MSKRRLVGYFSCGGKRQLWKTGASAKWQLVQYSLDFTGLRP